MERNTLLVGITGFAAGIGVGATLMYLLDPEWGTRRRALMRDQFASTANSTSDRLRQRARDLGHRGKGLAAEIKGSLGEDQPTPQQLEQRVRAALGRAVSNPSSIQVETDGRKVTLSGPILAEEVEDLLDAVASVRGVQEVRNQLQVHQRAEGVPDLQAET